MREPSDHTGQSSIIRSTACQVRHVAEVIGKDNHYADDEIRVVLAELGWAKQHLMDALDARAKHRRRV